MGTGMTGGRPVFAGGTCSKKPSRWILLAAALLFPWLATAQTFSVNSTLDTVDVTPGDGQCADASNQCSLRAAIQESNALAGTDTIILPTGIYTLTLDGAGEDLAATGDLDISESVTIDGAGVSESIIDGRGQDRVFDIAPNGQATTVILTGLTIRNGIASGASGGGLRVNLGSVSLSAVNLTGNRADANGGAIIVSAGTLGMVNSTLSTNQANGNGGAVYNGGTSTIEASTFNSNSSNSLGGGLYNGATAALINATLSSNNATLQGGALYNAVASTGTLMNATLAQNTAAAGGGVYNAGSVSLKNSLLSANTGGNCSGTITSTGNNLDSAATCAFGASGDLSNTDPLLGTLASNGGPTSTLALLSGSPAIDAGTNTGCPGTDQRGVPRPVDGNGDSVAVCDIGAYEAAPPVDLAIVSALTTDCVKWHDPLTYIFNVSNVGSSDAHSVVVTDILPTGVTLVSTTPACTQNGYILSCALGTISAGGMISITINVTADKVAQLINTASVAAAELDTNTINNSAEAVTRVNCAKGCFIATAAYGSEMQPQVQSLRVFRDRYLVPNPVGNWLVGLYYQVSPPLADVLSRHDDLRALVRLGLKPLVGFAEYANRQESGGEHDTPETK